MSETLKQIIGPLGKTKIIGRVEYDGLVYKLRLHQDYDYGIRPQMLNPETGKWYFVCGSLNAGYDMAGLRGLLLESYLSAGAVVIYDGEEK